MYWIDDQSKLIWKEERGNSSSFECAYVLLYKLNILEKDEVQRRLHSMKSFYLWYSGWVVPLHWCPIMGAASCLLHWSGWPRPLSGSTPYACSSTITAGCTRVADRCHSKPNSGWWVSHLNCTCIWISGLLGNIR